MPTGVTWSHPPQRAFAELSASYAAAIERGIFEIAQRWAPEIESWMKANAPWEDQTTNARQGLYTKPDHFVGEMVELIMAHGVEYGIYLELNNAGRYAIVNPALDRFAPLIWQDVVRLLS